MGLIRGQRSEVPHATRQVSPHTTTPEPACSRVLTPQEKPKQHSELAQPMKSLSSVLAGREVLTKGPKTKPICNDSESLFFFCFLFVHNDIQNVILNKKLQSMWRNKKLCPIHRNEERNRTIPQEIQTLELLAKTLNMLKELESMDKEWKETGRTTSQQMENSN